MEQVMLGLMLLLALCWNLAEAREVKSVVLRDTASGTRAEIALDSRAEYKVIPLSNPDRLVLDVMDTGLSPKVRVFIDFLSERLAHLSGDSAGSLTSSPA